jgi:hypothetical protein
MDDFQAHDSNLRTPILRFNEHWKWQYRNQVMRFGTILLALILDKLPPQQDRGLANIGTL